MEYNDEDLDTVVFEIPIKLWDLSLNEYSETLLYPLNRILKKRTTPGKFTLAQSPEESISYELQHLRDPVSVFKMKGDVYYNSELIVRYQICGKNYKG